MGKWRISAAVAALIALAGCGGSDQSEKPATWTSAPAALEADGYIVIPRTNVALRPPDGFQGVSSLPGMGRVGTRSTFLVIQGRSAGDPDDVIDALAANFSDEAEAARQGFEFESVERFSVDGRPAVGAMGTQTAEGLIANKAVVVFVSGRFLVTLTATLDPRDPVTAADAMLVLRSARWVAGAPRDRLGVAITPAAGYAKQAWSDGLCYALKGGTGQGAPVFVVTSAVGERPINPADRRDAARKRFRALPGKPLVESERRVKIAGLPGWEMTGTGREDGRQVRAYAAMVFTDGDAVIAAGSFDAAQYDGQMKAMRSMARSLVFP